jgi:adenosylmethionine-8-amino-7-oxononanoate aminotransferase
MQRLTAGMIPVGAVLMTLCVAGTFYAQDQAGASANVRGLVGHLAYTAAADGTYRALRRIAG